MIDLERDKILQLLKDIPDPEIPVISIEELGILQDVEIKDQEVLVTITPTYTGCPAMDHIQIEVKRVLQENGYKNVKIKLSLSPAWTTDWMSESTKKKLLDYGISPPLAATANKGDLTGKAQQIVCPNCKSVNTKLLSVFGSTACKALYRCNNCLEPFDYFKCL